jgi:ssDNA-binding Zn-finger/Zn-ribbon topoisomerase 1
MPLFLSSSYHVEILPFSPKGDEILAWKTASKTMTRKCDVCGASVLLRIFYDMFIVGCVRNGTCKL